MDKYLNGNFLEYIVRNADKERLRNLIRLHKLENIEFFNVESTDKYIENLIDYLILFKHSNNKRQQQEN